MNIFCFQTSFIDNFILFIYVFSPNNKHIHLIARQTLNLISVYTYRIKLLTHQTNGSQCI